jgi:membrane-associated phospholipid phosphatase
MNMILGYMGYYGPLALFTLSLYLLLSKEKYLVVYVVGYVLNIGLNAILKYIIQEPRPNKDIHQFNVMKQNNKHIPLDWYGMPSGHAQLALYSTAYMYNVTKNAYILILFSFISILTIIQRVYVKKHTLKQCIFGGLVGSLFGYYLYLWIRDTISNN